MATPEVKACDACRKAKRGCDKRRPHCSRCEKRGLSCVYHARPLFVLYGDAPYQRITTSPPWNTVIAPTAADALGVIPDGPSLGDLQSAWFLTSESWRVAPIDASALAPVSVAVIKRYVTKVQGWLAEWVTEGQNPFIHRQLYAKRKPRHTQDAFTALSSYFSRTPATEDLIFQTIEDRVEELVSGEEQGLARLEPFEHISRVQALLIYSTIRLYDGDIRQRHLAEQHLDTVHRWTSQMLSTTAQAASSGALLTSNAIESPQLRDNPSVTQETLLWHAWILAESVRRTWLVAHFIRVIYNGLQHQCVECPGGVPITTRRGVWEAGSAFAWTKICAESNVGLMHRSETRRFLMEGRPESCDPFVLAVMEVDFGSEQMERWGCGS